MNKEELKDYILLIISPLVQSPKELRCVFKTDDMGTLFQVFSSKDDQGRIIGKKGVTIEAVRHIVKIAGFNGSIRTSIKVVDDLEV